MIIVIPYKPSIHSSCLDSFIYILLFDLIQGSTYLVLIAMVKSCFTLMFDGPVVGQGSVQINVELSILSADFQSAQSLCQLICKKSNRKILNLKKIKISFFGYMISVFIVLL